VIETYTESHVTIPTGQVGEFDVVSKVVTLYLVWHYNYILRES